MIDMNSTNRELCFADSVEKPFYLYMYRPITTYVNGVPTTTYKFYKKIEDFDGESLTLTEGILEDSTFSFGSFVLPEITIRYANDGIRYKNMACIPVQKIGSEYVKYFEGFVKEETISDNGMTVEATIVTSLSYHLDDNLFEAKRLPYLENKKETLTYIDLKTEQNGVDVAIDLEFAKFTTGEFTFAFGCLGLSTQRMYISVRNANRYWQVGYRAADDGFWTISGAEPNTRYQVRLRIRPNSECAFWIKTESSLDDISDWGTPVRSTSIDYEPANQDFYLFARNNSISGESVAQSSPLKIYEMRMYGLTYDDSNTEKMRLYPYQNSFGVLGMLDVINNVFYPPANEKSFATDDANAGYVGNKTLAQFLGYYFNDKDNKYGCYIKSTELSNIINISTLNIPILKNANESTEFAIKDVLRMAGEFLGASIRVKKQLVDNILDLEKDPDDRTRTKARVLIYPTNELCFIKLTQNNIYNSNNYSKYINYIYELPYYINATSIQENAIFYNGITHLSDYNEFDVGDSPKIQIENNVFIDNLSPIDVRDVVAPTLAMNVMNFNISNCLLETPYPLFLEAGDFCKIPIDKNRMIYNQGWNFVGGVKSDGENPINISRTYLSENHSVIQIGFNISENTDGTIFSYGTTQDKSVLLKSDTNKIVLEILGESIEIGSLSNVYPNSTINIIVDITFKNIEDNDYVYEVNYRGTFNGLQICRLNSTIPITQYDFILLFPDIEMEIYDFSITTETNAYRFLPAIDGYNELGVYDINNNYFVIYQNATSENVATEYLLVPMTSVNVSGEHFMLAQIENNLSIEEM